MGPIASWTLIIGVMLAWPTLPLSVPEQGGESPEKVFRDEPEAHALYDKMVETMRKAESLSYESTYRWEAKGKELTHCTYAIWMKKPNYFRVEASHDGDVNASGSTGHRADPGHTRAKGRRSMRAYVSSHT
jgi:hypothetical protein